MFLIFLVQELAQEGKARYDKAIFKVIDLVSFSSISILFWCNSYALLCKFLILTS